MTDAIALVAGWPWPRHIPVAAGIAVETVELVPGRVRADYDTAGNLLSLEILPPDPAPPPG